MIPFETIKEAERYLRREVTSGATGTDIFMAKCFPLMLKMFNSKYGRQKRKPTRWNRHVSRGLKAGKSMKLIANEWKDRDYTTL